MSLTEILHSGKNKINYLTQVATHKILGVRRPFSLKVIDAPQDFVASTFILRLRKHNLEDYATKMATCVI